MSVVPASPSAGSLSFFRALYARWQQTSPAGKVLTVLAAFAIVRTIRRWIQSRHTDHLRQLLVGAPVDDIHGHFFQNSQGLWIYHCVFRPPPNVDTKACIVLTHGFSEHTGRYYHVFRALTQSGYHVYSLDHQGHGRSYGDRAHVEDFKHYIDDMMQFVDKVVEPDRVQHGLDAYPMFLLGHSMGGLIAILTAQRSPQRWRGVVLSGPALMPDPKLASPILRMISHAIGTLFPKMKVPAVSKPPVSRDMQVQLHNEVDPLVYKQGFRAGWCLQLLKYMQITMSQAPKVEWPFLLMQGSKDLLIDPEGAREFYRLAKSSDKELKMYEGLYHEVFNEPEREMVIADMLAWLDARVPTTV